MIHDSLSRWRNVPGLATHAVWKASFLWLESNAATAAEGDHPLGQEGFLARVMGYPLKSRDTARYEMHRRTIDIQYTIEGAEGIEVTPVAGLVPLGDYSEAKEVEHFVTPGAGQVRVDNVAGWFTILFPGEPHMPQLQVPGHAAVRKVVIKIPLALVG
jgi:biofilm protein TabA